MYQSIPIYKINGIPCLFQSANLEFPLRRYGLHLQTACWCNYLGAHLRSPLIFLVLVSIFQHLSFCFTNPFVGKSVRFFLKLLPSCNACRAISTYLFTFTIDDLPLNYYRVGFSRIILRVPWSNTRRRVLPASNNHVLGVSEAMFTAHSSVMMYIHSEFY